MLFCQSTTSASDHTREVCPNGDTKTDAPRIFHSRASSTLLWAIYIKLQWSAYWEYVCGIRKELLVYIQTFYSILCHKETVGLSLFCNFMSLIHLFNLDDKYMVHVYNLCPSHPGAPRIIKNRAMWRVASHRRAFWKSARSSQLWSRYILHARAPAGQFPGLTGEESAGHILSICRPSPDALFFL